MLSWLGPESIGRTRRNVPCPLCTPLHVSIEVDALFIFATQIEWYESARRTERLYTLCVDVPLSEPPRIEATTRFSNVLNGQHLNTVGRIQRVQKGDVSMIIIPVQVDRWNIPRNVMHIIIIEIPLHCPCRGSISTRTDRSIRAPVRQNIPRHVFKYACESPSRLKVETPFMLSSTGR